MKNKRDNVLKQGFQHFEKKIKNKTSVTKWRMGRGRGRGEISKGYTYNL